MKLNIQEEDKVSIAVTGRGCAISQASGSLLAEKINMIDVNEIQNTVDLFRKLIKSEDLTEEELDILGDVSALSGVRKFPVRIKCAMLSWVALEDIVKQSKSDS